jgi:heptose I phosphotransferase
LIINSAFASLLRNSGWSAFDAIWKMSRDAAVAKQLRTDRITLRFTLSENGSDRHFYIKRHTRSSWKEYLKPLLQLSWPILGARNEWNALIHFHQANIPTMIPVALGESGENSFLITEALENCVKLSELNSNSNSAGPTLEQRRDIAREVARIARLMHSNGMHHQDFYLGHLLLSKEVANRIYVIDLGRVRKHSHLSQRWIVKDLAQLNYSSHATPRERLRFLRDYLNRALRRTDKSLIRSIERKTQKIARHSRKNDL